MKLLKLLLMLIILTACTKSTEVLSDNSSTKKQTNHITDESIVEDNRNSIETSTYKEINDKPVQKLDVATKTSKVTTNQKDDSQDITNKEISPKDPVVTEKKESAIKKEEDNKTSTIPKPTTPPTPPSVSTSPENPPVVDPPKEVVITKACPSVWYDEDKPCDFISSNLLPTDELGRSVPSFKTSQEAWNWGAQEINNDKSTYGCRGFTRMDGYYNDGRQFFFAYLKVCDQ